MGQCQAKLSRRSLYGVDDDGVDDDFTEEHENGSQIDLRTLHGESRMTLGSQSFTIQRSLMRPGFNDDFSFSSNDMGRKLIQARLDGKALQWSESGDPMAHQEEPSRRLSIVSTEGFMRKLSVSSDNPLRRMSVTSTEVQRLSAEEKLSLAKDVKNIYFFRSLDAEEHAAFLDVFKKVEVEEGGTLYTKDDVVNYYYVVHTGKYQVYRTRVENNIQLNRAGETFCLTRDSMNGKSKRTIRALEKGLLWAVHVRSFWNFVKIFMKKPEYSFLKDKVGYLSYLMDPEMIDLAMKLVVLDPEKNQTISTGDSDNKSLYIVSRGTVLDRANATARKQGQVFGEGHIFCDYENVEVYTALEDTQVLRLHEKYYERFLTYGLRDIFEDKMKLCVLREIQKMGSLDITFEQEDIKEMLSVFKEKTYSEGHCLAMPGKHCDKLVILRTGELAILENEEGGVMQSSGEVIVPYYMFGLNTLLMKTNSEIGLCVKSKKASCFILKAAMLHKIQVMMEKYRNRYESKKRGMTMSLSDLTPVRLLGKGQFGKVIQVQHNKTKEIFALKVQYKKQVTEYGQVDRVYQERITIGQLNHPFIVKFVQSFKDKDAVYLLMEPLHGGELFYHIDTSTKKRLEEHVAAFYAMCILSAMKHMHKRGIIYRDLKPENILLDKRGFPKLVDFGCAKQSAERNFTICGTPEYVPPETIQENGYDYRSDYWQFGVLLYEMLCGFTPFDTYIKHDYTQRIKAIYEKILFGKIPYPRHLSTEARDLLSKLLVLEPANRFQGKLDRQGKAVREHPWFKVNKISHSSILKTKPPIKPRKMRDTHDMTVIVDPKMRSKSMEGEKVKGEGEHDLLERLDSIY